MQGGAGVWSALSKIVDQVTDIVAPPPEVNSRETSYGGYGSNTQSSYEQQPSYGYGVQHQNGYQSGPPPSGQVMHAVPSSNAAQHDSWGAHSRAQMPSGGPPVSYGGPQRTHFDTSQQQQQRTPYSAQPVHPTTYTGGQSQGTLQGQGQGGAVLGVGAGVGVGVAQAYTQPAAATSQPPGYQGPQPVVAHGSTASHSQSWAHAGPAPAPAQYAANQYPVAHGQQSHAQGGSGPGASSAQSYQQGAPSGAYGQTAQYGQHTTYGQAGSGYASHAPAAHAPQPSLAYGGAYGGAQGPPVASVPFFSPATALSSTRKGMKGSIGSSASIASSGSGAGSGASSSGTGLGPGSLGKFVPVEDGFLTTAGNKERGAKYGNETGQHKLSTADVVAGISPSQRMASGGGPPMAMGGGQNYSGFAGHTQAQSQASNGVQPAGQYGQPAGQYGQPAGQYGQSAGTQQVQQMSIAQFTQQQPGAGQTYGQQQVQQQHGPLFSQPQSQPASLHPPPFAGAAARQGGPQGFTQGPGSSMQGPGQGVGQYQPQAQLATPAPVAPHGGPQQAGRPGYGMHSQAGYAQGMPMQGGAQVYGQQQGPPYPGAQQAQYQHQGPGPSY